MHARPRTLTTPNDPPTDNEHPSTPVRAKSGTRTAFLLLATFCIGLWVAHEPPCHGILDHTAIRISTDRLNAGFAQLLPDTFEGASIALRLAGFQEGNRLVGTDYRHRPVPEPNPVFDEERRTVARFNQLLREHKAELIRPFAKSIEASAIRMITITIYLLKKPNGSITIHARRTEHKVLPGFLQDLLA